MRNTLVVDLDQTLIHTDMLFETFWGAFSMDWKIPIKSIFWLFKGKANLKYKLHLYSNVDVATLPYNKKVINFIKKYKKQSGYIILVTASNHQLAKKIAKHLNLFDEVRGSTNKLNLKGKHKAKFLKTRFGFKKFDYIGDSLFDLPIWKNAKKAITTNANSKVIKACRKINSNSQNIKSELDQNTFFNYIKTLRIHQWIKNILVFIPMLAAHQFTYQNFMNSFLAFVAFCLIASHVYIVNDLLDLNSDRVHSYKKFRPLASGHITIKHGMIIMLFFFTASVMLGFFAGGDFLKLLLIYWLITFMYSLIIKKTVIIDVFVLGILYTLRIVGGSFATEINVSLWLLVFSIFIFLSLASIKRQSEIIDLRNKRKFKIKGRGYNIDHLSIVSFIVLFSAFMSVLVAVLYVNSQDVISLYPKPWTLSFACVVLFFWLVKMIISSSKGLINGDPILYALKDGSSRYCLVVTILLFAINFI